MENLINAEMKLFGKIVNGYKSKTKSKLNDRDEAEMLYERIVILENEN